MSRLSGSSGEPTSAGRSVRSAVSRRLMALLTVLVTSLGVGFVSIAPASATVGVDWTVKTPAEANWWNSVVYGNGTFVAVASGGAHSVMTSPDGATWTARTAAEGNSWQSIAFGNGVFVALSYNGTHRVMTSPDGVTWTARTAAEQNSWNKVAFGNGLFVAVSTDGTNRAMTSPDGVTWTARAAAEQNLWEGLTYGNGLFVAVAYDGTNRVMTSPDGVTWTARSAASGGWVGVTYGAGLFVAVAQNGTNQRMTSADGVTWTGQVGDGSQSSNQWMSVTYGGGLFVAVSFFGSDRVTTSPDGLNWTARTVPSTMWTSVTYAHGLFVAVGGYTGPGTDRVLNSGTFVHPVAPAAPTALSAVTGSGSASVAFTAGADGGASITKYQYRLGNGSWSDAVGTSSPITISGLIDYTSYSIRLRAVNEAGLGPASAAVTVRPRAAAPVLKSATAVSPRSIKVSFGAVLVPGATVKGYSATAYAKGTDTVVASCRAAATGRACDIKYGLTAGVEYDVRVQAFLTVPAVPAELSRQTLASSPITVTAVN